MQRGSRASIFCRQASLHLLASSCVLSSQSRISPGRFHFSVDFLRSPVFFGFYTRFIDSSFLHRDARASGPPKASTGCLPATTTDFRAIDIALALSSPVTMGCKLKRPVAPVRPPTSTRQASCIAMPDHPLSTTDVTFPCYGRRRSASITRTHTLQ